MMTLPERSQLWWNLQSEQALQKDPNSGPTWTEKPLSLSLKGKSKPSVLSAHGEEEEGITPNASQREESLAPYRTHCHVLMGSIIYFTQWLEGEEQGDQGLGGGWLWETPRTPWGSFFFLALGEVKWLKTDTSKQLQQHQGKSRKPRRHILVCMDSLPTLWACPQVPRPLQPPHRSRGTFSVWG